MTLPYENATSGKTAITDMQKILKGFGAETFGCMENFAEGEVIVQFRHRGRDVVIKASARGYATAWLKEHPWTGRTRMTMAQHQARALNVGQTAVYSILRDWIKGQITAVEVGMLTFEGAFLGQLLLEDGSTVMDRVEKQKLLRTGDRLAALP